MIEHYLLTRLLIEGFGVDGIITDDPPLLSAVIEELGVGD